MNSSIESIEYYPWCPSCGAANTGKELCDYCGATLIKSRDIIKADSNKSQEEEENFEADMNLPEISGKLQEKDEFLIFFCPIFGGIFLLVPTIICIVFSSVGMMEPFIIAMLSLFWIIGIGAFVPLVRNLYGGTKCKNGKQVLGTVRGYDETMVLVNGKPVLKMRLLIDDPVEPKILVLNTGNTRRIYPVGKIVRLRNYKNSYIFDKGI